MSRSTSAGSDRSALLAVTCLIGFAAAAFAPTRATNFRGFDEWLNISLLSQGILDVPYANRPLNMIWGLPAWTLFADALAGFLFFHVAWLGLTGALTFLIARRLLPGGGAFAFLAGALAIVWAPGDRSRLCSTQMILYSGCTFGVLLATWLTLVAWSRRRFDAAAALLAAAAVAAAACAVMSFEASLAPLGLVPLVLLAASGWRDPRRLAAWTLGVALVLAALGLRAVLPRYTDPQRVAYQSGLAPDFTPGPLLDRTRRQLRRHLAPALQRPPTPERSWPAFGAALALYVAGMLAASRRAKAPAAGAGTGAPPRAGLVIAASLGLLGAALAYLPFVLNPETHGAERMQFLSTPGVAVLLAACAFGVASLLPQRARLAAAALVGGWLVAGGVARTAGLQAFWDERSAYPDQRKALLELTAVVPDVAPGTLVVLLDGGAWALDLSFRHALHYLYEGRAVGHSPRAMAYLYETRFETDGVHSDPRPVVRGPWREPATVHAYDSVVVVREEPSGRVRLLDAWPDELGPLPPGAAYAPRARIRSGPRLPRLAILKRQR